MEEVLQFMVRHGYTVLFLFVFVEQVGLPIPATPVLLAMGALAASAQFSFAAGLLVALLASLFGDLLWYYLGRYRGHSVLNLICRISLEPDSCVRRTTNSFARYGRRVLLFAKFVPGLNTVAPPLSGMFGMGIWTFLVLDSAGALIWIATLGGLGYLLSAQLERVAAFIFHLGNWSVIVLGGGLATYIGWKYVQRQRLIRGLRIARITPEELMRKLAAGEDVVVVDLRHSLEIEADNVKIPGALDLLPKDLGRRHQEIPRGREIVLYCT